MFELPAFLPPTHLELPMYTPSALTEHVSLNLARLFLLDPVEQEGNVLQEPAAAIKIRQIRGPSAFV